MKTLNKLKRAIEATLALVIGSFCGLIIAAAGMHNLILGLAAICLGIETIILGYDEMIINEKIKEIKEKKYV